MRDYLEATSVDPFNVFQNTPDMALKDIGCSRPGDYVEFEVLKDAVVGVSSCPYDVVSAACSACLLTKFLLIWQKRPPVSPPPLFSCALFNLKEWDLLYSWKIGVSSIFLHLSFTRKGTAADAYHF